MATPFIDKAPTPEETTLFQLAMSSFCDGSGQERDTNGITRPGWRDFERIVAELLEGFAPENKDIFDIIVPDKNLLNIDYGISLKSKQLGNVNGVENLASNGRVHMELANSPAKFWMALRTKGVTEEDFRKKKKADLVGTTLLDVIRDWHLQSVDRYNSTHSARTMDLSKSIYMTISYGKPRSESPRKYQIHSFSLEFPDNINWKYISDRCLRGYDPLHPEEALIDWYALSGGQLKYYPRASIAKYHSESFELLVPKKISIMERASVYWPKEWIRAGGRQFKKLKR